MTILIIIIQAFNPDKGGVQRTTYKLGKRFTELGHTIHYFSCEEEGHIIAEYGTLHTAAEKGNTTNPKNIDKLEQVIKEINPDVVINQAPYVEPMRNLLSGLKSKVDFVLLGCLRNSLFMFKSNIVEKMKYQFSPSVFSILNNPIGKSVIQMRHKVKHGNELKKIIDAHDKYILLAPPNRKELEYFIGDYKSEKVISIPNSIPDVFDSNASKKKVILHVGRINLPQKRSDLLLDFWKHCHEQLPDWTFVIVGDGEYMDELRKELKEKGYPRVKLEGFQKPEKYYEEASIFMMPSAFEGFPNTLLEAQSYGCVPYAFNSYLAVEWIVNDGKDAFIIPPFDTKAMANKVINVAKDPEKLERMRTAAYENAAQFTIEKVGEIWQELFSTFSK